jgi:uncharacterized membrane protein
MSQIPHDASPEHEHYLCQICGRHFEADEVVCGESVRPAVMDLICEANSEFEPASYICQKDLNQFRNRYTHKLVEEDLGELTVLEKEVLESLKEEELLSENINQTFEENLTFGQALSDKIASFGGSWRFILTFGGILVFWILLNTVFLPNAQRFDEYPFILLNLVLSCLAALQAPVIMMSQNRQEAKDRLRGELDYKINLKAELEIRHLLSKLDQLRHNQWRRLLEIQHIQLDLMHELTERKKQPSAVPNVAPSVAGNV